jgi:hypothetical protein
LVEAGHLGANLEETVILLAPVWSMVVVVKTTIVSRVVGRKMAAEPLLVTVGAVVVEPGLLVLVAELVDIPAQAEQELVHVMLTTQLLQVLVEVVEVAVTESMR